MSPSNLFIKKTLILLCIVFSGLLPVVAAEQYERCKALVSENQEQAVPFCLTLLPDDVTDVSITEKSYIYGYLATISALNGDHKKADAYLDEALAKNSALLENTLLRYNWLRRKGLNEYKQDKFNAARSYMQEALDIAIYLERDTAMATSYNDLGAVFMELGLYEDALSMLLLATQRLQKLDKPHSLALTLANIGAIHRDLGRKETAVDYYTRAIQAHSEQLQRTPEDKLILREYAHNYEERGIAYLGLSMLDEAEADLNYAIDVYQQNGFTTEHIRTLAALARLSLLKNDSSAALTFLRQAQALEGIEGQWQSLEVLQTLVDTHLARNELSQAKTNAHIGLTIANEKERFQYQMSFLKQLAAIHKASSDLSTALDYLGQYLALYDDFMAQKHHPKIADLQAVIEVQEQQKEIELLEYDRRNHLSKIQLQNWIILSSIIIILLFCIILFLVLRQRKRERMFLFREIAFHKSELERLSELEECANENSEQTDIHSELAGNEHSFNQMLVALMCDCIDVWEQCTGTNRVELAEQSKIWAIVIDNGRLRARTMDKYTDINRLPDSPRWRQVVRTCRYILINCSLSNKQRNHLNTSLDNLLDIQKRLATTQTKSKSKT